MTCGLVNASFSLPEWQAVKMIFFAPCCWNPMTIDHYSEWLFTATWIICKVVTLINIPMNKNSNLLVTAISYFNYFLVCMSLLGKLSKLKSTRGVSTWISYSAHVHSMNFGFVLSWPSVTLCEDLWMYTCFKTI